MVEVRKHRKYACSRRDISDETVVMYLTRVKKALEEIQLNRPSITTEDIIVILELNKTETKQLNGYINNKFDCGEVRRTNGFGTENLKSKLLPKLAGFEERMKTYRKARLTKHISFWPSVKQYVKTEQVNIKKVHFKEGTVLPLSYYHKQSNLYVFNFGNGMKFPLTEDEFEFLVEN